MKISHFDFQEYGQFSVLCNELAIGVEAGFLSFPPAGGGLDAVCLTIPPDSGIGNIACANSGGFNAVCSPIK